MDYKRGLTELKSQFQTNHPDQLIEFSTLEARLLDNLNAEQQYGTTETARADRARVIRELNRLALETVGISFNDMCTKPSPRLISIPLPPQPYFAHPYPLQANFTGRFAERKILTDWLTNDQRPILTLVAIGGMGKSSLSWYWLQNDVDLASLEGILWWSFYEGESSFAKFLDEVLIYIGNQTVDPASLPSNYDKARTLVNLLQQRRVLLVLDGFERQLRAYASLSAAYQRDETADEATEARGCIDPSAVRLLRDLAAGPTQAKVLITSRLMVRGLEDRVGDPLAGCRREALEALHPDDAVAFMRVQGVTKGTRSEITTVCEGYGYHPLSLRLLSGLIARDKRNSGNVATAPRHDVHTDLVARQHHVLEAAYNVLPGDLRMLLSRMAAFRSPIAYDALVVFNEFDNEAEFDGALDELIERGLLFFDRDWGRYDLHPIVRRYTYDHLADKERVHTRLQKHFAAVLGTVHQTQLTYTHFSCHGTTNWAEPLQSGLLVVDEEMLTIELYHHTVRARQYDEAWTLFRDRLWNKLYYRFGAYETQIELLRAIFPLGENKPPNLTNEAHQGHAVNELANAYGASGQPRKAVRAFKLAVELAEKLENKRNVAIGLGNLAIQQAILGELAVAERTLRRHLRLCRDIEDEAQEAVGHQELGRLLAYQGVFDQAEEEIRISIAFCEKMRLQQGHCQNMLTLALRALLMRETTAALEAARRAGELADVRGYEFDIIRVEWLLGVALVALAFEERDGQSEVLTEAETHLAEALIRCRRINLVEVESDILLAFARWHHAKSNMLQAGEHAIEALTIADRCEYRLKQADIHNFLAQWKLDAGNITEARKHAQIAKERAWCDGPPHCYKPALDESERILNEMAQL